MSSFSGNIFWFVNRAFDTPQLKSPQPCVHGAGCNYMTIVDGIEVPGCCVFVHPGEEGTGRRFFPGRTGNGKITQPACVRLTGNAGFYERRKRGLSWREWCKQEGIPYYPHVPGEPHKAVKIVPINAKNTHLLIRRPIKGGAVLKPREKMSAERRYEIGQTLWDLVRQQEPVLAGKLVGMFLEAYTEEKLIHLINSRDELKKKIRDVLCVLLPQAVAPHLDLSGVKLDWVTAFGLNRCNACGVDSGEQSVCGDGCKFSTPERGEYELKDPPPLVRISFVENVDRHAVSPLPPLY